MRRRLIIPALFLAAGVGVAGPTWAADPFPSNPPATPASPGTPTHTCGQSSTSNNPGPGHAPISQSAFNPGGTGGSTYNPRGQYDVACFQTAGH